MRSWRRFEGRRLAGGVCSSTARLEDMQIAACRPRCGQGRTGDRQLGRLGASEASPQTPGRPRKFSPPSRAGTWHMGVNRRSVQHLRATRVRGESRRGSRGAATEHPLVGRAHGVGCTSDLIEPETPRRSRAQCLQASTAFE